MRVQTADPFVRHVHAKRFVRALRGERIAPWLFLAPALSALIVFKLVPVAWLVVTSLRNSQGEFVGLDNFRFLFGLESFVNAVRITLTFIVITVPLQIAVAFALALLLSSNIPGRALFRSAVYVPVAVPGSVAFILWGAGFRVDGLANAILKVLSIDPQPFLRSQSQALLSIVLVVSWMGVGLWMVFLIGGLKDIPPDLYEASALDGSSRWTDLVHITVPLMRRPLAFVVVADTAAAALLFAPVAILTRGGPGGSTQLIMYDIYQQAFVFNDLPLAAAEALTLVTILIAIVVVQFRLMARS